MNNDDDKWAPPETRKIVQKFSIVKLEEFRRLSIGARLAWLEDIKLLYWKTAAHRRERGT